jgi:hypothetical protein
MKRALLRAFARFAISATAFARELGARLSADRICCSRVPFDSNINDLIQEAISH